MLKTSSNNNATNKNEPNHVPDFIVDNRKNPVIDYKTNNVKDLEMGHKGHYTKVLSKNNVTQSLPNCVVDKHKTEETDTVDSCDIRKKLLDSPPQSPWFKTWPERDKFKALASQNNNTQNQCDSKPNLENGNIKNNKVSLNEALQNISLAYSPVTKQLHVVEKTEVKEGDESDEGANIKKGHKRHPSSFSSTISSISEPSPSKSLLDVDQKSLGSLDDCLDDGRKRSLTQFFTRNVFASWRSSSSSSASSSVWKFFGKNSKDSCRSPHRVASSTALIQHPRPSNLPAKTQEEEQRHREQHKAIIAAAKKKEAQNNAARQKQQKLQLQQEEHQATAAKHFIKHVLPNWEQMRATKKTRHLWWQGLPSSVRGRVWRLAIGNELNLTPQLYEICLSRAQNRLNSPAPSHSDLDNDDLDKESSMDVIQLDISRTFPHLCIFQEGGPYSDVLHSLLAAYVCYRPDVGYVQGMSYIAAILILNMEACDAFICFANLLNQPLHLSAFTLNQQQMEAYYDAYNEVFMYNLPKLYQHFEEARLTPDLYLLDWIYTVFAKAMPLDVACRVWDIFLRDGCEFIFRTALGILHLNQDTLIEMDFLHGAQFLTRLPDDLSSDQLFKSIQAVTTTIGKQNFCQIVDKYSSCR